jgi:hypothetical protein
MANYHYMSLHQAWVTNQKLVNIYGVITRVDIPRPCSGTDYKQRVWVTDQSARDISFGGGADDDEGGGGAAAKDVMIMFFGDRDALLTNAREGDIVRIHRLEKREWQRRPQFVAKIGVIRSGAAAGGVARCHFCLFRGLPSAEGDVLPEEPFQTSSQKYTFNVTDRANVKRLRELVGSGSFRDAALDNPFTVPISSITHLDPKKTHHADQYDLHCKVLEVITNPETGRTTLVVWDGSDSRPFPPGVTNLGPSGGGLESQTSVNDVSPFGGAGEYPAFFFAPFEPERAVTRELVEKYEKDRGPIPKYGSAFPVVMRNFDIAKEDMPSRGAWIRLMKLSSWVREGQRQGLFTQHSSWAPSQPNPSFQEAYSERLENNDVAMWAPRGIEWEGRDGAPNGKNTLTKTAHAHVPLSTLREVLASPAPSRHRVAVRVVAHYPKDVHDFCSSSNEGGGVTNSSENNSEWSYNLSLVLEDGTARLKAHLAPPESNSFFHGVPACDLWESSVTYDRVAAKTKALVEHHIDRPHEGWVVVCLMSYLVPAHEGVRKRDKKQSKTRCFQIFGTSVVGPHA